MKIRQEIKNSSAILAFEYDIETEILEIQFASGGVYAYPGIPEKIVVDWMKGLEKEEFSTGKYFNQKIRKYGVS